jgi:hypothetical protein
MLAGAIMLELAVNYGELGELHVYQLLYLPNIAVDRGEFGITWNCNGMLFSAIVSLMMESHAIHTRETSRHKHHVEPLHQNYHCYAKCHMLTCERFRRLTA